MFVNHFADNEGEFQKFSLSKESFYIQLEAKSKKSGFYPLSAHMNEQDRDI
jgi:hypothetical protein